MSAVKKLEETVTDSESVDLNPEDVDGEATRLIRITLNKLEEGLDTTKRMRGSVRRIRSACTPPPGTVQAYAKK